MISYLRIERIEDPDPEIDPESDSSYDSHVSHDTKSPAQSSPEPSTDCTPDSPTPSEANAVEFPAVHPLPCPTHISQPASFSDITLNFGSTLARAHRVILAASSGYFKAMLSSTRWREACFSTVTLPDPPELLLPMLKFIYQDPDVKFDALNMLPLAFKYQIPALATHCSRTLSQTTSLKKVFRLLPLAARFELAELEEHCLSILNDNLSALATEHSQQFHQLPPVQVIKLLSRDAIFSDSEYHVYTLARDFLAANPSIPPQLRSDMFRSVRYEMLTLKEFARIRSQGCVPPELLLNAALDRWRSSCGSEADSALSPFTPGLHLRQLISPTIQTNDGQVSISHILGDPPADTPGAPAPAPSQTVKRPPRFSCTARLTWEIPHFHDMKTRYTRSPSFSDTSGHTWSIILYPKGGKDGQYLSIYVYAQPLIDDASPADFCWNARFKVMVVHPNPKEELTFGYESIAHAFTPTTSNWGWSSYASLAKIDDRGYFQNDTLVLKVFVCSIR
eukprot:gnl/Dysnectes_brevis/3138_a3907_658.p2 GENE.gnl/Dysnectes_brevis/3138_a3907_658~~gnl/Dysnectes_brevis/3138_a3907_658.p2  ORF type:complete len:506 (-),score=126.99 gnl/Dysnectes_brevis/3138_a3907_658:23-1540(-)